MREIKIDILHQTGALTGKTITHTIFIPEKDIENEEEGYYYADDAKKYQYRYTPDNDTGTVSVEYSIAYEFVGEGETKNDQACCQH